MSKNINVIDHTTLAVSSTSIGLSSCTITLAVAIAAGAKGALIIVEDGSVYWRQDGDAATNADIILYKGDILNLFDGNWLQPLDKLRFLRVTGDAVLQVIYFD